MRFEDSGTESVWEYPRPPVAVPCAQRIRVAFGGVVVADSVRSVRVLETSHPPVYYLPAEDVRTDLLVPAAGRTRCEWKGTACYWDLQLDGRVSARAAWSYPEPLPGFEPIRGALAFYPGRVDECLVGDERVSAQPGDFYGGWITSRIRGPFKGSPGTGG
ncbi:DUF427 domain-containing protein [Kitasatospora sp. A2-31]|uniref:DUF427 domain-containing protein n=1 Tax=Kitasatospora sp. A2-31 TaxID=2916414 RepID=UPI001EECCB92|nr:DUF427 domain-containing protein [Kitasatospora sp. A2-31]MCG6498404.1 DUF427 domain-containing protein [Kitasatospora sp. A2-31]